MLEGCKGCSDVAICCSEVRLLVDPLLAGALSGCTKSELVQPAFAVVEMGGNGSVGCFCDVAGGYVEW